MRTLFCPSMMCADIGNLKEEIQMLEESDMDIFHLDIMDGQFVPNFGMGFTEVQYLCEHTSKPVDAHLMIEEPARYAAKFVEAGCQIVYIHPEADPHSCRTLQEIKDAGGKPGIAVNPGTSYESVEELLPLCEYVLLMTVNPGFAGQTYLGFVTEKLKKFVAKTGTEKSYKLIVDGACSPAVIRELGALGADGFVLGTSALFGKGKRYKDIIETLRREERG